MRAVLLAAGVAALVAAAPAHAKRTAEFPNVELTTQDGRTLRFYDDVIKGRSVAINVIFTSCKDVCPLETANMVQLKRALGARAGREIHLYSISIDPQRDTPEVLRAYAEKFGAQWTFLTGKPQDIKAITKRLALIRDRDNPTSRQSHHAALLYVGDEPTRQWTRFSAVDSPSFLAARMGAFLGWRDSGPAKTYAEAKPVTVHNGQRLFQSKCAACHTVGRGDRIGPDLAGVADRRESAWLARYIAEPDEVLAKGDPIATALYNKYKKIGMPNLRLGSSDVSDLVSFLADHPQKASTHQNH
jgi:protein SCO1